MASNLRIGQGYDVHRLEEGYRLILGGVEVPYEKGLKGHSDADVLVHAIMDALLGAAAAGDIGRMFPDTAAEFAGISSLELLRRVRARLREMGFLVVNVDSTIVAQKPKLAGFLPQMRENIAAALELAADRVNIKATTEEWLGFTGDGSGMAAQAVVLLEKTE